MRRAGKLMPTGEKLWQPPRRDRGASWVAREKAVRRGTCRKPYHLYGGTPHQFRFLIWREPVLVWPSLRSRQNNFQSHFPGRATKGVERLIVMNESEVQRQLGGISRPSHHGPITRPRTRVKGFWELLQLNKYLTSTHEHPE